MKLELGWFYISIGKDGFHIEIEIPNDIHAKEHVWLVLSCLKVDERELLGEMSP